MPASISPSLRLFRSFSFLPRRSTRIPASSSLSFEANAFPPRPTGLCLTTRLRSRIRSRANPKGSRIPFPSFEQDIHREICLFINFVINSCTDFFYVFPRLSGSRALVRDWRMLFLFFLIINLIVEKCGGDVT